MIVYFIRHGIADWPNWNGSDDDRPLNGEGRKRMRREAKVLLELGLDPDAIVTSPLVRARQTAEIVARKLDKLDALAKDERMGLGFDGRRLRDILNDHADARSIALVGHEPSMSSVIGELVGGARLDFKKGSVACVDVPGPASPRGVLLWFAPPKVLLA